MAVLGLRWKSLHTITQVQGKLNPPVPELHDWLESIRPRLPPAGAVLVPLTRKLQIRS
ncbi:MAG TPA: hypothetical protein VMF50_17775 [Candidatus Binataceae bacterium]|nr:hypothetical protein [Candidatus Binataceae bacterium]